MISLRRFPFHSLEQRRRCAGLPARRDRAEKSFRLTNDSGRDRRWFFPAAEYRSAARRRRAVPSRAIRRRRFRRDPPSRKNRRAGRDESPRASRVIARRDRFRLRRRAPARSRAQSAPPSAGRRPAFGAAARSDRGSPRDIPCASQRGERVRATGVGSVDICRISGSSRRRYHCSGSSSATSLRRARLNSAKASFQRRSRK